MLEVKGFRGLRFVPERVQSLDAVITPPYDVITAEERRALAGRNPYSMVRLILPEEEDGLTRYEVAARYLDAWIADGILEQDRVESFYLIEQTFRDGAGGERMRRGFLGVAKLPEADENYVLGHERTFPATTEDRVRLTEATRANLGPVFALYADRENRLDAFLAQTRGRPPDFSARTIDDVAQRVWRVPHDGAVMEFFRGKRLYIADGHHRFQTARVYRDEMRKREQPTGLRPYDYVLMGFVSITDPGLLICATHRLMAMPRGFELERFISVAKRWFDVEPLETCLAQKVAAEPGCAIGVAIRNAGQYLLRLRLIDRVALLGVDHGPAWRNLDVAVLHRGVIERVMGLSGETPFVYERDAAKALDAVARGDYGFAFVLKATSSDQICACAEAGEPMPHKSTYFFPKLPSGAVIHRLA